MAFRMVHQILSACDISITSDSKNFVRVRITETNPEQSDPSDFTIEGDRESILNLFANAADVIENIELLGKEPN